MPIIVGAENTGTDSEWVGNSTQTSVYRLHRLGYCVKWFKETFYHSILGDNHQTSGVNMKKQ